MNPDFIALLSEFFAAEVRFLIVGAYAVAFHSRPRSTGVLDLWLEASPENARRVMEALKRFGAPLADVTEHDLSTPGVVYQVGIPPRRIDLLTSLTEVGFDEAWRDRVVTWIEGVECAFIGRAALARNKRALGRPKDLADLELLDEQ